MSRSKSLASKRSRHPNEGRITLKLSQRAQQLIELAIQEDRRDPTRVKEPTVSEMVNNAVIAQYSHLLPNKKGPKGPNIVAASEAVPRRAG